MRRIEQATGVRRETAGRYLKAAGISVRAPGGWGRRAAKPANEVTTDLEPSQSANQALLEPANSKPGNEVTTDSRPTNPGHEVTARPSGSRSVSNCEPYREVIESALNRGRNAMAIWQDLVTEHGFDRSYQSVKRFVNKLRPAELLQARSVIVTAPGEEAQVDYGTGLMVRDRKAASTAARGCS